MGFFLYRRAIASVETLTIYVYAPSARMAYGQKTQPRLNTPGLWCMSQAFVRDFDRDERRTGLRDLIGRLDIRETHLSPTLISNLMLRETTQRRDNSNSAFLPAVPGIERVRSSNRSHLGSR
jgi:hypothetical protein